MRRIIYPKVPEGPSYVLGPPAAPAWMRSPEQHWACIWSGSIWRGAVTVSGRDIGQYCYYATKAVPQRRTYCASHPWN
ncbi:hypothetical protein VTO73DRAFT_3046 [Trametes versicolor]